MISIIFVLKIKLKLEVGTRVPRLRISVGKVGCVHRG